MILVAQDFGNAPRSGQFEDTDYDGIVEPWDEAVGEAILAAGHGANVIAGPGELVHFIHHDPRAIVIEAEHLLDARR